MEWNDIVYLSLLFSCVGFGHIFRQVRNKEIKKWLATCAGFIIIFIVSGQHILHPLFSMIINALIIKFCDKR